MNKIFTGVFFLTLLFVGFVLKLLQYIFGVNFTLESKNFKGTKYACYFANVVMSAVFGMPPILFLTFREMYGISYTLLGSLVLINFFTQLGIDLIFTFFSSHFNIKLTVRIMPLITTTGLIIYALVPTFFPQFAYLGLVIGTVVFSVAAGLCEVLVSPTIAAIPSKTPDRDMSLLHSLYGYGLVFVVIISTLFLWLFGNENWMYLTLFWAILPIIASILFFTSPMPEIPVSHNESKDKNNTRNFGLALCAICIFLGGATECAMTNWISGFTESALKIPKIAGDIFGMALFALLLAITRTLYAKFGKNILKVLTIGMAGASICYLLAGLSSVVFVSFIACVLVGIFSAMLWPGTLILMEEKFPNCGVAAYALMAAGGDLGGSIAPQLLGIVVDKVTLSEFANNLSATLHISTEQIGMKTGMITASIFPILGLILLLYMKKYFKKATKNHP